MTRLGWAGVLLLPAMLASSPALADSTPIVKGVPGTPVWQPTRSAKGTLALTLDSLPPASVPFYFEVPIPAGNAATGTLEVWPLAEAADSNNGKCAAPPGGDAHQYYKLAMSTAKDGDQNVLRATVPALQVNQPFCFLPKVILALTPADLASIASDAAQAVLAKLTDPTPGAASCNDGLPALKGLFMGAVQTALKDAGIITGDIQRALDHAVADYLSSAVDKCAAAATAQAQSDAAKKAVTLAQKSVDAAQKPVQGSQPNPTQTGRANSAQAPKKADASAEEKTLAEEISKAAAAQKASNTAAASFSAALSTVFGSTGFAQGIVVTDDYSATATAGQGVTPAAANYASVDAGAFVGFPSGGTTSQPMVVPYLGLNFYTTAVDRTVPLDQLTGTLSMRVRQRLSLTLGSSLATPSVPGRTVSAAFSSIFPVVGLGCRVSQYLRLTAGAIIYNLADINPASAAEHLSAAPFVGGSLDIDVIHILTQAKL
jgi:hypothetical protein